ncbi:unnamed protein product [Polarella glacialis]|uniref:Uncharacterized protein n=1 Tax=Polarella glacialis TaxID=89957 RepID=A0A813K185_POLGL|nr:unnamed protein product [Polarella glacialis]
MPVENKVRVLDLPTGFYNLSLDIDVMTLNVAVGGSSGTIRPAVTTNGVLSLCAGPADTNDGGSTTGGYPVRLVRLGRYLAHYWIGGLTCGGAGATFEIKVWPDCFELHLVLDDSSLGTFAIDMSDFAIPTSYSAQAGYAEVSFCTNCNGLACTLEDARSVADCCPLGPASCGAGPSAACEQPSSFPQGSNITVGVQDSVQMEAFDQWPKRLYISRIIHPAHAGIWLYFCANPADIPEQFPSLGTSFEADFIPANVKLVAAATINVQSSHDGRCSGVYKAFRMKLEPTTTETSPISGGFVTIVLGSIALPVAGEVTSWKVSVPSGSDLLRNDRYNVALRNPTTASVNYRLNFHIDRPSGITGIAVMLRNASNKAPSGLHVQISKNWHTTGVSRIPHDGTWYSAVMMLQLPPESELVAELLFVYQYFGTIHTVSHAQLSLIGWGKNGLWEEVGLGVSGESICYEPEMQHRRNLVTDVRPFLVCGMGSTPENCKGNVGVTAWTENHGGMDFLAAYDASGSYQYLVRTKSHHSANGPRLTNASYSGLTVDAAIRSVRTVSTWSADDFARHLHSFHYEVLQNVSYARLILYQLGADWYNFAGNAHFAYGNGDGLIQELSATSLQQFAEHPTLRGKDCEGQLPCWFAFLTPEDKAGTHFAHRGLVVRRWQARLGGVEMPFGRGFSFSLVGVNGGVGLQLRLPAGISQALTQGDFVSADLEVFLYPKNESMYYGTSQRLRAWLSDLVFA